MAIVARSHIHLAGDLNNPAHVYAHDFENKAPIVSLSVGIGMIMQFQMTPHDSRQLGTMLKQAAGVVEEAANPTNPNGDYDDETSSTR